MIAVAVALLSIAVWVRGTLYPQSDMAHAVFRVAVCLAAVTVAIPRGRLVRWGLALWAVGIVSSTILAPDPWRALWSTHNRNEGAWQVGHYLLLVVVAAAVPRERLVKWLAVAAGSDYEPAFPRLREVLTRVGRMKYLRPLYTALGRHPRTRALAREIFESASPTYHSLSRRVVSGILEKYPQ